MSKPRIILITGVSRGLGQAMARKFAALRHIVVGCGRSKQAITRLQKELVEPHRFSVVDVTGIPRSPNGLNRSSMRLGCQTCCSTMLR